MELKHFQGYMHGRTQKTHQADAVSCHRYGSRQTGMTAELKGEFIGGRITIRHNPTTHRDWISFSLIGGYDGKGTEEEQLIFEDIFETKEAS